MASQNRVRDSLSQTRGSGPKINIYGSTTPLITPGVVTLLFLVNNAAGIKDIKFLPRNRKQQRLRVHVNLYANSQVLSNLNYNRNLQTATYIPHPCSTRVSARCVSCGYRTQGLKVKPIDTVLFSVADPVPFRHLDPGWVKNPDLDPG
jgi:hypothetical protein